MSSTVKMRAEQNFDVIVVGVGAMGSATLHELAKRRAKVLGIEQFAVGHDLGSSHGETRLIRQAYFEHPNYVPLLKRSYELWSALENDCSESLLHLNGLVLFGPQSGKILPGVRKSARQFSIPVAEFDPDAARVAFPHLKAPPEFHAVLEPGAGYLDVEHCVLQLAKMAVKNGAQVRERETVQRIEIRPDLVIVETTERKYYAAQLVVTAGAWSPRFLPEFAPKLTVNRVSLFWFKAAGIWATQTKLACFGFDTEDGFFYGVPAVSDYGVKVGLHRPGAVVQDPTRLDRNPVSEEMRSVCDFVQKYLEGIDPTPTRQVACMYTMTPDENFLLGKEGRVSFAAGFSGHGFKFAPVIGESLADLALTGSTELPIDFLKPRWPHRE